MASQALGGPWGKLEHRAGRVPWDEEGVRDCLDHRVPKATKGLQGRMLLEGLVASASKAHKGKQLLVREAPKVLEVREVLGV